MIKHIKRLLGIGQEPVATAPYKVETPAETAVSKPVSYTHLTLPTILRV